MERKLLLCFAAIIAEGTCFRRSDPFTVGSNLYVMEDKKKYIAGEFYPYKCKASKCEPYLLDDEKAQVLPQSEFKNVGLIVKIKMSPKYRNKYIFLMQYIRVVPVTSKYRYHILNVTDNPLPKATPNPPKLPTSQPPSTVPPAGKPKKKSSIRKGYITQPPSTVPPAGKPKKKSSIRKGYITQPPSTTPNTTEESNIKGVSTSDPPTRNAHVMIFVSVLFMILLAISMALGCIIWKYRSWNGPLRSTSEDGNEAASEMLIGCNGNNTHGEYPPFKRGARGADNAATASEGGSQLL